MKCQPPLLGQSYNMNKYIGEIVTINKPAAHNHGRCGEVKLWNENYEKFEVHFDEGWGGFYTLKELTFEDD
mgnify:CR=1 FL=1